MRIETKRSNPISRAFHKALEWGYEKNQNWIFRRDIKKMPEEEKAFAKKVAYDILNDVLRQEKTDA